MLNRLGLGQLRNLEHKPPVQRYEREHPGDLIHIDVKKLSRFRKVGHRITGNRQQGQGRLKVCPCSPWRACHHWVSSAGLTAPDARNRLRCSRSQRTG